MMGVVIDIVMLGNSMLCLGVVIIIAKIAFQRTIFLTNGLE